MDLRLSSTTSFWSRKCLQSSQMTSWESQWAIIRTIWAINPWSRGRLTSCRVGARIKKFITKQSIWHLRTSRLSEQKRTPSEAVRAETLSFATKTKQTKSFLTQTGSTADRTTWLTTSLPASKKEKLVPRSTLWLTANSIRISLSTSRGPSLIWEGRGYQPTSLGTTSFSGLAIKWISRTRCGRTQSLWISQVSTRTRSRPCSNNTTKGLSPMSATSWITKTWLAETKMATTLTDISRVSEVASFRTCWTEQLTRQVSRLCKSFSRRTLRRKFIQGWVSRRTKA